MKDLPNTTDIQWTTDVTKDISKYITVHEKGLDEFKTTWQECERNFNVKRGIHWDETQKAGFENEGRIAWNIPKLETDMQYIEAQQINNRYDWRTLARQVEHELGAEQVTYLYQYIEEYNDFKWLESECFSDALAIKYAAIQRQNDYSHNPEGEIELEKIPYNEVMWDLNCKKYDISKYADWMERFGWFTRDALKSMFPTKEDLIDRLSENTFQGNNAIKELKNWFSNEHGKQTVKVVWHYQRKYKKIFKVLYDNGKMGQLSDDKEKDYSDIGEIPALKYQEKNMLGIMTEKKAKAIKSIPRFVEYIECVVFSADNTEELHRYIIYPDKQGICKHPIHILFCFFSNGVFYSYMDLMIDTQRILDRLMSQADFGLRKGIKGANYEVVWNKLHTQTQQDWSNTAAGLNKGGQFVLVNEAGSINPVNTGVAIQPEVFKMISEIIQMMDSLKGGNPTTGQAEYAGQSGKAIRQVQEAGLQKNIIPIDSLKRWRKSLGEGLLENIREVFGTDERQVRVMGDSMSQKIKALMEKSGVYKDSETVDGQAWMDVNKQGSKLPPIADLKLDLVIEDTPSNPLVKDRQFEQLMDYTKMKVQGGGQPLPAEVYLSFMDIDATLKATILDAEEKEQQALQAQQQEMQKDKQFERQKFLLEHTGKMAQAEEQPQDGVQK